MGVLLFVNYLVHLQVPTLHPSSIDEEVSCSSLPAEPEPSLADEDIVMKMPGEEGIGADDEELESTEDGEHQHFLAEDIDDPAMDLSSCPSTPKVWYGNFILLIFG